MSPKTSYFLQFPLLASRFYVDLVTWCWDVDLVTLNILKTTSAMKP